VGCRRGRDEARSAGKSRVKGQKRNICRRWEQKDGGFLKIGKEKG